MKRHAGALLSSIQLDRKGGKKLSVQLYMALRDLLLSGALQPGVRMPASRVLAEEVGVSRTTVIDAVDRLIAEGLLEARVGAGTYVSKALDARPTPLRLQTQKHAAQVEPRLSHAARHAVQHFKKPRNLPSHSATFVTALPALDAFPMAQWAKLSARHWRKGRDQITGYGEPFGYEPLRRAIAQQLSASRGIHCEPEQIFITNGAQRAFSLVAELLVNPGESIWMENPGAIGARNAFLAAGAQIVPVSVDDQGLSVEDGLRKAPHFRVAFATPSHQQPLGHVMSLPRRLALLKAADAADAMILEDDYDGEFFYGEQPLPTLKSIDTNGRVIYVGTFSKSLFPALRLGFALVPDSLVESCERMFSSRLSGVPTATQAVVADFIEEGMFATHLRTMRQLYKERYEVLFEAGQVLAGRLDLQPTQSGFHLPAFLSNRWAAASFVQQAGAQGLALSDLRRYCIEPISKEGVVLGFGNSAPESIRKGIAALDGLLRS